MPIIKEIAPVIYPESDYKIAKYLDLIKYISLLQKESLFFCRLDKLEDKFEGTTAKGNFVYRVKSFQDMIDLGNFSYHTNEEIIKIVRDQIKFEDVFKAISCVNCWNKYDDESAALWKIYSDFNKGIMITSSISKLVNSFKNAEEKIILCEISYIDYSIEIMPEGSPIFPLIHKQKAYSYEEEVRLIYEVNHIGWKYDWSKEEVTEGVFIKSNLFELIDDVILAPNAPNWYLKLIQDITDKYNLNFIVKKSKLSIY